MSPAANWKFVMIFIQFKLPVNTYSQFPLYEKYFRYNELFYDTFAIANKSIKIFFFFECEI